MREIFCDVRAYADIGQKRRESMGHDHQDTWKHAAGVEAVKFIEEGMVLGIGSGTTATKMSYALWQRIHNGLRVSGAGPTSQATPELASKLGIPLTYLDT